MGWRERDWARYTKAERKLLYGRVGQGPRPARAPIRGGRLWLAALFALAALIGGSYASGVGDSILSRAGHAVRSAAHRLNRDAAVSIGKGRQRPIGGASRLSYGSVFSLHGRTAGVNAVSAVGPVALRGRWGTGQWLVLDRTQTDGSGSYSVSAVLNRRGTLRLRLSTPDGFVGVKMLRVH